MPWYLLLIYSCGSRWEDRTPVCGLKGHRLDHLDQSTKASGFGSADALYRYKNEEEYALVTLNCFIKQDRYCAQRPMAEVEGFEPPRRLSTGLSVFKTDLFDLLSTLPYLKNVSGGGGAARTLASVARPKNLANSPLHQLGYASNWKYQAFHLNRGFVWTYVRHQNFLRDAAFSLAATNAINPTLRIVSTYYCCSVFSAKRIRAACYSACAKSLEDQQIAHHLLEALQLTQESTSHNISWRINESYSEICWFQHKNSVSGSLPQL